MRRSLSPVLIAAAFSATVLSPLAHAMLATPADADAPPTAQQMSEIAGDYQLSDGRRMSVDFDGTEVYVQLDKRPRQQLQGGRDGQFRTLDGAISIRRKGAADAAAIDVRLSGQAVAVLR